MRKGIIFTLLSAVFYGLMPVLGYISFSFGNDPFTLTFFKFFFALPVLFLVMVYKKISVKIEWIDFFKLFFLSIVGALMTAILLSFSYKYIRVGTSTALHFLYPIIIMIISKFYFKDVISSKQKVSIFLSLIGIFFFINFKDLSKIQGLVLALLSSLTYGFFVLFIEKWKIGKMNNFKFAFYISFIIVLFMLILNPLIFNINFTLNPMAYLIMFVISIFTSFLGVILLKQGIEILGARIASIICVFEPITALAGSVIFLHDQLVIGQIFGSGFIILSIVILNMNFDTSFFDKLYEYIFLLFRR